MNIPALQTGRLTLRAPAPEDFPIYRDFYADADASVLYGGPLSPELARAKLERDLAHWQRHGHGMWSVVVRDSGAMVGGCGLVWPKDWPRRELTWWIIPSARRNGYALEASREVIRWGYDVLGWDLVKTHMNDSNDAARSLAERLGGSVIARETFPDGLDRNVYALPYPDGP